jgi:hypothetical protein
LTDEFLVFSIFEETDSDYGIAVSVQPGAYPKRGGTARQPIPKIEIKKKRVFVDAVISKILRDLPFSPNQPLNPADE